MPGRARFEAINVIYDRGLIARLAVADLKTTQSVITAQADGGARVVDLVTQPGEGTKIVADLAARFKAHDPVVVLGAGPADDAGTAAALVAAGVDFVAGAWDPETARLCNRNNILYLPLVRSGEEIAAAVEAGAEMVRVQVGDPDGLARLLAADPRSRLLPAGGVKAGEVKPWFQSGAVCLCFDPDPRAAEPAAAAADLIWEAAQARGLPLFSGVEHLGTYPQPGGDSREIVDWYVGLFGFNHLEGEGFHFVSSGGPGRIEILKQSEPVRAHVAIKVRHLGAAVLDLEKRGLEFEPVKDFGRTKAIFLKQRDPAGNKVHLLYQAVS